MQKKKLSPKRKARSKPKARLSIRHDMARILQIACDADEASPTQLLNQIADIAAQHPWPKYPRR